MSHTRQVDSRPDMSKENYGAVPLYRIPAQSIQDGSEKIPRLSGIGIVPNDFKTQTVRPQFSYELLRSLTSHGETEFQFRLGVTGFVIFRYGLPQQHESDVLQHSEKSNFTADEFAKAGIRMPSECSHKQCKITESSAVLRIELEMPLDPLKPNHIAVPKIPLSSKPLMAAEVAGITLPEHVPCSVLTSSSSDLPQIPVTLENLPPCNPPSEFKALISQAELSLNPGVQDVWSSTAVYDKQLHNLGSAAEPTSMQDSVPLEASSASDRQLCGQVCKPRKTVWDVPHLLVPIFAPLSSCSLPEHVSASTTWTLVTGYVAVEKYCLMYVPSSVLTPTTVSDTLSSNPRETLSGPSMNVDNSLPAPTSKSDSFCHGQYIGNIFSLGYDNGTIEFTMDKKEQKASFCRSKVYVDGIRIGHRSKLRDVLSCKMPVTFNVKQYRGESFSYKATAVYVETFGKGQLEVCHVASDSVAGYASGSSDESTKEEATLQQAATEDEMYCGYVIYLSPDVWNSCPVEHRAVRKHMYDCVCRVCTFEQKLTSTKSCKELTVRTITLPGEKSIIAKSTDKTRQEVTGKTHLSKEILNTVAPSTDVGMLNSASKPAVLVDDQGKVKVPKLCTEFKPPDFANSSGLVDSFISRTQKITTSDNGTNIFSTRKTITSYSTIPLNHLPKSATNITGIIESTWSSDAAIMISAIHNVKVGVLISSKNLYVDGKQCAITDVVRQHLVEGTVVYADVSKLTNHPSGAAYFATCAWKGKKPTSVSYCSMRHCNKCGIKTKRCVDCLNRPCASIVNLASTDSKVNVKHKDDGVAKNCEGMCNDVQRGANSFVEAGKQRIKNLEDGVFVGTVQSFTLDDGFGVVNFQFQNEKVKAIFFRESIFAKGVALTDNQVKDEITAGRSVDVSAVSPYYGEDIPYAARIDIELQDRRSHSVVAVSGVQEEKKVKTIITHDLELPTSKFAVKQREMFYESRLYYDWDNKTETCNDKCEDINISELSDEVKTEGTSDQAQTLGDANVTASLNNKEEIQLPVTPTQYTGYATYLKRNVARVKRYESSTVGVLECSIYGAEVEVMFDKNVVNFSGSNESTNLTEYLPVGTEVYFEGKVRGEDSLLGCPDIVVSGVWESTVHKKKSTSKLTNFQNLQLTFPSMREGLVAGREYEGIVTQIRQPFAFVATVAEGGKAYDVFVLNKFFSPVEYGMKLPAKCPVIPYIAEGFKVHILAIRQERDDSRKNWYEWIAVDAWTEQGDNAFPDNKPEQRCISKELNTEDLEGVIVTLHPDRGLLRVDHIKDEVTFFGQSSYLFGIQLAMLDLCKVFRTGERLCFKLAEKTAKSGLKKASRAWFGSSDMHDIGRRSVNIFNYCKSRKIDEAVLLILTNELGKQRHHLETRGMIETSSADEEEEGGAWPKPVNKNKPSRHTAALVPDANEENGDREKLYCSNSLSDCDNNVIYVSDGEEEKYEIGCTENFSDQPESMASILPCFSDTLAVASNICTTKIVEDSAVNNTSAVMSSSEVTNLERTEDFIEDRTHLGSTISPESEHDTLPVTVRVTEENGCIFPVPSTGTSQQQQQHMIHTQSRNVKEGQVTSASTEQFEGNIQTASCQQLSMLHPEMQRILHLSLYKALQNYGIKSDLSQLIASQAVTVVEEEMKAFFRDELFDRVLKNVSGLGCDTVDGLEVGVKTKEQAVSQLFVPLRAVSEEWRQIVSEIAPTLCAAGTQNKERDAVGQVRSGPAHAIDQAAQTISTGNVFFLKILPD
ncbi:uncharacterized protein LOC110829981 isoform X1 [Zootermopsis nevadensis]|uniref:uncharacterized protein LOC110829981 isoform X1 n=1 Tax=Zootermopsis nevadensis TaxID=136037 RepID=UPI000B8EE6BA|nr:uncharacterized protein LOC110829981 isoform X1 [Zootermopsis nevadensis]XP_021919978.1 uncharacterized protein LOC110829981 isoform X1 [Zootermopsis nevadensis]XP_021919980.1 uncharacterized protein LOC110829981 isoform X1 [Zootermopsis nevadensis]